MLSTCYRKEFVISLYCVCQLPESFDDNMIMCDSCENWFHFKCVNITTSNTPDTWKCSNCNG